MDSSRPKLPIGQGCKKAFDVYVKRTACFFVYIGSLLGMVLGIIGIAQNWKTVVAGAFIILMIVISFIILVLFSPGMFLLVVVLWRKITGRS